MNTNKFFTKLLLTALGSIIGIGLVLSYDASAGQTISVPPLTVNGAMPDYNSLQNNITSIGNQVGAQYPQAVFSNTAVTSGVMTTGMMLSGIVSQVATTAPVTSTTDAATTMLAGYPSQLQSNYQLIHTKFRLVNGAGGGASAVITVAGGSGVTTSGTMTVAANAWRDFLITFQSVTSATVTNIGGGTI